MHAARVCLSLVKFVFLRCACVRVPRAGSNLPPKPTYSPGQELFNEAFPEETGGRLPQFRPSFAHRDWDPIVPDYDPPPPQNLPLGVWRPGMMAAERASRRPIPHFSIAFSGDNDRLPAGDIHGCVLASSYTIPGERSQVNLYEDTVLRRSCFEMNETLTHEAALADNLWLTTGNNPEYAGLIGADLSIYNPHSRPRPTLPSPRRAHEKNTFCAGARVTHCERYVSTIGLWLRSSRLLLWTGRPTVRRPRTTRAARRSSSTTRT